jgi:hypothetical protein
MTSDARRTMSITEAPALFPTCPFHRALHQRNINFDYMRTSQWWKIDGCFTDLLSYDCHSCEITAWTAPGVASLAFVQSIQINHLIYPLNT